MTDPEVKKLERLVDELKNEVYKMRNRVERCEAYLREIDRKNMELQGRCSTLTGRLDHLRIPDR